MKMLEMEKTLKELLDKIYELEGLAHLALKRSELQNDFMRLIRQKAGEVLVICGDDRPESFSEEISPTAIQEKSDNYHIEEYSIDDEEDPQTEDVSENIEYLLPEDQTDENTEISLKNLREKSGENSKGNLVFSINDKFRFRRVLFNGSEADFNNTLVVVASMDSYEEAEDYFINEQGWNNGERDVKDFLDILKRYFK